MPLSYMDVKNHFIVKLCEKTSKHLSPQAAQATSRRASALDLSRSLLERPWQKMSSAIHMTCVGLKIQALYVM